MVEAKMREAMKTNRPRKRNTRVTGPEWSTKTRPAASGESLCFLTAVIARSERGEERGNWTWLLPE